jgi:hypothetical protein
MLRSSRIDWAKPHEALLTYQELFQFGEPQGSHPRQNCIASAIGKELDE